jgi:hypothetical protein
MQKLRKLKKEGIKSKTESESFSYTPPLQGYLNHPEYEGLEIELKKQKKRNTVSAAGA